MVQTYLIPQLGLTLMVATAALSMTLHAASVTHQWVEESRGRIVADVGENAEFDVQQSPQELIIKVNPDSVYYQGLEVLDPHSRGDCTLTQLNRFEFSYRCSTLEFKKIYKTLAATPKRFIVEFELGPHVVTPVMARVTSTRKQKSNKIVKRSPATAELPYLINKKFLEEDVLAKLKKGQYRPVEIDKSVNIRDLSLKDILKNRNRVFFKYAPLRKPISFRYQLPEFELLHDKGSMFDMYNLSLKLFKENKYALALRTLGFMKKEDPAHPVWKIASFLEAEIYTHLAADIDAPKYFQEAISRYKTAIGRFPKEPYAEPAVSHVAKMQIERGEYFGAIDTLVYGLDTYKKSKFRWEWRLGIAESFIHQNRFQEARQIYGELLSQTEDLGMRLEGLYRVGDSYMMTREFDDAIFSYLEAIAKESPTEKGFEIWNKDTLLNLPSTVDQFPSVFFNLAEAYFWKEDYRNSIWVYNEFVNRFPLHEYRSLAYTRIGELFYLFETHESFWKGSFLEAKFRHPESLGADLAKLRLDMSDLVAGNDYDSRRAQKEFEYLENKYQNNPLMVDFMILFDSEVLLQRKDYKSAYQLLENNLLAMPGRPYRDEFKIKIFELLSLYFRELRRGRGCVNLFDTYYSRKNTWFTHENPYFNSYIEATICGLKMHAPELALEFIKRYEDATKEVQKDADELAKAKVIQNLAHPSELLFYKGVAQFQTGDLDGAKKYLSEIISMPDSPKYTKDSARIHLALIHLKQSNTKTALNVLTEVEDQSVYYLYPYEILFEVSELQKNMDFESSLKIVDQLLRTMTLPSQQIPLWMTKADVYWSQNDKQRAKDIYKGIVELSENQYQFEVADGELTVLALDASIESGVDRLKDLGRSLRKAIRQQERTSESIRAMSAFRIGVALREKGSPNQSLEYFNMTKKLSPQSAWGLAAQSEINSIEFESKYRKSIDRYLNEDKRNKGRDK